MLFLFPLLLATGSDASLFENRSFVTEGQANAVAVGDLDANGLLDLVIAESGTGGMHVLLQTAPASYEAQPRINPGSGFQDVLLADLNGDGALDAVATNAGGLQNFSVLLGDGTGGFPTQSSAPLPGCGVSVAAGDLDGDGDLDLVFALQQPDAIALRFGLGDGSFTTGATQPLADGSQAVTVGDITGNGALDLLVAGGLGGGLTLFTGVGDGTFDELRRIAVPDPEDVALGDLDGDGDLDAVVASHATQMPVLENVGGSFAPFQLYAVRDSGGSVELFDADGDGDLDAGLALIDGPFRYSGAAFSLMQNDGAGAFARGESYGSSALDDSCSGLVVRDLDADGALDAVVVGTDRRSIALYPGDGAGGFRDRGEASSAFTRGTDQLEAADFNGDGLGDLLICGDAILNVDLFLGNGDGTYNTGGGTIAGYSGSALVTADFDSDGNLDCAFRVRTGGGREKLMLGLGDGLGDFPRTFELELQQPDIREFAAIDWDGNGAPDLLGTVPSRGGMTLYFGDGAGGVLPQPLNFVFSGVTPTDVAVADLDGDGDEDFAVADPQGARVRVVLNGGDGTVEASLDLPSSGGTPERVAVLDLDGDGLLEIASGGPADEFVDLFVPADGGGYADALPIAGGTTEQIAAGDVDGDGHVDLVTYAAFRLGVHLGDGRGGLLPVSTYDADGSQGDLALFDENGDGRLEIFTTRPGANIQVFRLR